MKVSHKPSDNVDLTVSLTEEEARELVLSLPINNMLCQDLIEMLGTEFAMIMEERKHEK